MPGCRGPAVGPWDRRGEAVGQFASGFGGAFLDGEAGRRVFSTGGVCGGQGEMVGKVVVLLVVLGRTL